MNKHEEARNKLDNAIMCFNGMDILYNYINECEATEKELEDIKYNLSVIKYNALKLQNELVELKRDVQRYWELKKDLVNTLLNKDLHKEYGDLVDKLSKVSTND